MVDKNKIKEVCKLFNDLQLYGDLYQDLIGKGVSNLDVKYAEIITEKVPGLLKDILNDERYKIKGSIGQGRITACPWIAIMDKNETTSTQEGVYLVFLFSKDLKKVYLTLGQGVTKLESEDIVKTRDMLRDKIHMEGSFLKHFNDQGIENEKYKLCAIYSSEWKSDDVEYCSRLLEENVKAYRSYMENIKNANRSENYSTINRTINSTDDDSKTLNMKSLHNFIAKYYKEFPSFWEYEKYKWQAVSHFQNNWDIEAEDFAQMFTEATSKQSNLLVAGKYYPIAVIQEYAEEDKERTRTMFRVLFDESRDITDRIQFFMDESESIRQIHPEKWKNHYQDMHAISVYLAFRYPEKYYIYKFTELKNTLEKLGDNFSLADKTTAAFYTRFTTYMDSLRDEIRKDKKLCSMISELIEQDDSCYEDKNMNVTTVDFVFYVGKRLKDVDVAPKSSEIIQPNENTRFWIYAPGEGASKWKECQETGLMLLGWDEIGDFTQYPTRPELVTHMKEIYDDHVHSFLHSGLAIWQFCHDIKPGDVVFVKRGIGTVLGRGVVQGDYEYDEDRTDFFNKRKVIWTNVLICLKRH